MSTPNLIRIYFSRICIFHHLDHLLGGAENDLLAAFIKESISLTPGRAETAASATSGSTPAGMRVPNPAAATSPASRTSSGSSTESTPAASTGEYRRCPTTASRETPPSKPNPLREGHALPRHAHLQRGRMQVAGQVRHALPQRLRLDGGRLARRCQTRM